MDKISQTKAKFGQSKLGVSFHTGWMKSKGLIPALSKVAMATRQNLETNRSAPFCPLVKLVRVSVTLCS